MHTTDPAHPTHTVSPARSAVSVGRRTLGVGLAATVLAAGAYAYTASNTVAASSAGDGATEISGYAVTNVRYSLDSDPTQISGVSFDLDAAATTVKVKLDADGATWTDCSSTNAANTAFTCPVTSPVAAANQLAVVAAS